MSEFAPRTVLFDLDDTLYDFATTSKAALEVVSARIVSDLCIPVSETKDAYRRLLHEMMERNPSAGCHSRTIRFQLFLEERRLPLQLAPVYNDVYWNALLDRIVPFEGLPEALDRLRARNIRIGLGTNMTADWQIRKLDRLGIIDRFDFIVSSEEAAVEKPSPDFFRYCAAKAGCAPSDCLFIGDNLVADVGGARAAGMRALWFQPRPEKRAANPDEPFLATYVGFPESAL